MNQEILSILLADDEPIIHQTIGDYLRDLRHQVQAAYDGNSALNWIEKQEYHLALIDIRMPGMDGLTLLKRARQIRPELSIVLITAHGNMEIAIDALRLGAADFLTKPVKLLELEAILEKTIHVQKLKQEKQHLRATIRGIQRSEELRSGYRKLLGNSEATRQVREQMQQIVGARLETILLTGETGSGKEVVAREIHSLANPDKSSPFIAVSCPALPPALVESELFGHVKGAFTGATADREGYFELANGGTLFLDEVADLSPGAQASLLRVLETRTLRRVGGAKEIEVFVRVIAATNIELENNVEQGKFRRDLYYRLNVYSIHLLPLRERKEDILPLADHFLTNFCQTRSLQINGFSSQAEKILINYDFPGNARELKNVIERAAVLCKANQILPEHLNLPDHSSDFTHVNKTRLSADQEYTNILKALETAKWNRRIAAKTLGMPYSTLRFKMQKLGIR